MKYLFNDRNLVRAAVLTALNVVPSSQIFRTDNDAKLGSGIASLVGPYTGAHDTVIEIHIIDGTGDSSQVSQPVFRGIGNGAISDVSVTSLAAQDFTVTAQDLGTQTVRAIAPFQGATLRALQPGQVGNLISISVDPSAIVRTPIDRALQGDLQAGTNAYTGTEWDFGAVALDAAGNVSEDSPRLSFGDDPQVYVAFKDYDYNAQQWVFGFSPPPIRNVQQGAIVKAITGTWGMTITDGTTTENYTGIVTLRDALSDIQSAPSALCEVVTAITNDHTPSGMAAMDLSVWTRPLILSINEDGSLAVRQASINFTADATAPTESVVIRCTDASTIGAEIWSVGGDITQGLPNAVTGVAYAEGPYTFTIPVQLPNTGPPAGTISVQFNPIDRADGEQDPVMCIKKAVLGARARNAQYNFVLKKKPPAACICKDDIHDSINWACLGIDPPIGGEPVAETSILVRRRQLAAAYTTFVDANTTAPDVVDPGDITWALKGFGIFSDLLNLLSGDGATLDYPARQDLHVYAQDEQIEVTISSTLYRFTAIVPGTSASSSPSFTGAAALGSVVTDGGVSWQNIGKAVLLMFDDAFNDFVDDADTLAGVEATQDIPTWQPGTSYSAGNRVVPTVPNNFYYIYNVGLGVTGPKVSGAIEPFWPTEADGTVSDPEAGIVDDTQSLGWKAVAFADETASGSTDDRYFERYRAPLREVALAAGITPDFSDAGTHGTPCWRDFMDNQFWFVNTDGVLKPLQLGHTYYATRDALDGNGNPTVVSTEEFALQLLFGCPLKVGDGITIVVGDVTGAGAYQQDDTITIVVAHQDPVPFGGGQLGNDMVTFGVHGTSDGDFPPYHVTGVAPAARINSHSYLLGDIYQPASSNGHFYECTVGGTSASSPPSFPVDRSAFSDGGATFQDLGLIDGYSEGGLAMTIVSGAIAFALADEFDFSAIGGHFEWRQDGGSWTGPLVIGTEALVAGISTSFVGGAAPPSWAAGDIWAFLAQAINGPDQIEAPVDGRFAWTTSTTLHIAPADDGPASCVAIFDHNIPADATITLEGSDDDFGTPASTTVAIAWQKRNLFASFAAVERADWRIVINRPGDCFWIFLGEPMQPTLTDPGSGTRKPDVGHFTRRKRAAGRGVRSGIGGDVLHDVVDQISLEDFEDGFDYACSFDNAAFGLVINDAGAEVALVRFTGTDIETKDVLFDYQASQANRYQSFTVTTEALP